MKRLREHIADALLAIAIGLAFFILTEEWATTEWVQP
jgi:hypothetical protein